MGSPKSPSGLPGALLGSLGLFGAPRALQTLTISTIILAIITIRAIITIFAVITIFVITIFVTCFSGIIFKS